MAATLCFVCMLMPGGLRADPSGTEASRAPNILYIFTDDQSARSVSSYEEARPWAKTPNIDELASSGMRFTSCYTGAWCQPSRASTLTGLLQHALTTLEITDYPMAKYDPEQLRFFPAVFREHGYETACIGKWHLGEDAGHGRDWDYSVIWDRGGGNSSAYYNRTLVRTNGGDRKPLGGYSTDRYTELAVDYIDRKKDGTKPWYLWLCYGGVHSPYTPAARHDGSYNDAPSSTIPVDIFGPRPTKPSHLRDLTRWQKDSRGMPKDYDSSVKKYHRAVKSLDDGVGSLMDTLQQSGQLENTIVIFTSDQGFAWGHHGSKEKWMPYDSNLCAPLVFSAPGLIKPSTVCTEPVNGVDITRTIHALAGIEPEWEMHGRDLSELLAQRQEKLEEPMLMINTTHQYGQSIIDHLKSKSYSAFERKGLYAWMMMRSGQYKYVRHFKDDVIEEVYDLEEDPDELNNLAVSPHFTAMLGQLRAKAVQEFQKRDGEFVEHLPEPKMLALDHDR
ncbi:sulfatase-like hydrolase/transferase [Rhodopirellula sp. SWK7]|uniref:sulfatase-like hydrolase/transferase n=1 Tax=Rhodopirellula sp. SWK7 TaxID=595460 RepID=UPI00191BDA46|nr:sulfatase-like hydrolase/transferase [Rhodopirellula sp. SWK7]